MEIEKRKESKIALKIGLETNNVKCQIHILCGFMFLCYYAMCASVYGY